MDTDKPSIKLTGRNFEKLLYCLKNSGLNRSMHVKEIVNEVCPLARADTYLRPFAINCLKLPTQEDRKNNCVYKECPLLGESDFLAEVTRKGPHIYNVNPRSGLVTNPNFINNRKPNYKYENLEDFEQEPIRKPIRYHKIPGLESNHSDALLNILKNEYSRVWQVNEIEPPSVLNRQFIESNTAFKFLFIKDLSLPIPTDPLTMELTGWSYVNPSLSIDSLAQSSNTTIVEVLNRKPLYSSLVQEINNRPFPYQSYMELKSAFEEI